MYAWQMTPISRHLRRVADILNSMYVLRNMHTQHALFETIQVHTQQGCNFNSHLQHWLLTHLRTVNVQLATVVSKLVGWQAFLAVRAHQQLLEGSVSQANSIHYVPHILLKLGHGCIRVWRHPCAVVPRYGWVRVLRDAAGMLSIFVCFVRLTDITT